MLTTPHWVLDPTSPKPGEPGPITVRNTEDGPTHWPVCVIPGSLGQRSPEGEIIQLLDEDDIRGCGIDCDCTADAPYLAGVGSLGWIHRRMGRPLLGRR
jgi:hypothetical protein